MSYQYLINEINPQGQHSLVLVIRNWLALKTDSPLLNQEDLLEEIKSLELKQYERLNYYNNQMYKMPRLNYAMSDDSLVGSNYGQVKIPFNPWTLGCKKIRDRIEAESSIVFNSCLINAYRDQNDMVDFHGDREALGADSAVITVSLGDSRYFSLVRNCDNYEIGTYLNSGDLVLMKGATQKTHKHSIPREKVKRQMRYSITYRFMDPSKNSSSF